jgi:hypothetical protein
MKMWKISANALENGRLRIRENEFHMGDSNFLTKICATTGLLFVVVTNATTVVTVTPEKCFDDICIGDPRHTQQRFVESYGRGYVSSPKNEPETILHCYYDPEKKIWIQFEFDRDWKVKRRAELKGILISTISLCDRSKVTHRSFSRLVTERGVAIGLSETDVVRLLGKPQRVDDAKLLEKKNPLLSQSLHFSSRLGESRFAYFEESSTIGNFVYFQDKRVISIWITEGE